MWLLLALIGCAPRCPDLDPIDYADDASWICLPGRDDACSEPIRTWDATADPPTLFESLPAENPAVDCFYVYPTMDWRLRGGVHTDLDDRDGALNAVRNQAARLHESCRVFVPAYRQVTLGTYAWPEKGEPCFDSAFSDVADAFEQFLLETGDRPFVLVGHSQGGQIVSRLLAERVQTDPTLQRRLVVAMPLGWPIADEGATPLCTAGDDTGCVLGFRTFLAGHASPRVSDDYAEGEHVACVSPGGDLLRGAVFPASHPFVSVPDGLRPQEGDTIVWRDSFSAECVEEDGDSALEITWEGDGDMPIDERAASGKNGTHILDLAFTQEDLVHTVAVRGAAWTP